MLTAAQDELLAVIARQQRVCVHRDFHSRNLLVLDDGELGIVDYQDALWGPYAYDPVSLLRDCYVRWPDDDVMAWRNAYATMAAQQLPKGALDSFAQDFDYAGMQRHLKAIGIFARLQVRDGRSSHLADIPRVLGYLADVGHTYPQFTTFGDWIAGTLAPAFAARQTADQTVQPAQ